MISALGSLNRRLAIAASVLLACLGVFGLLQAAQAAEDEAHVFLATDGFETSNQVCSSTNGLLFDCADLETPNGFGDYVFSTGVAAGDINEDGYVDAVFSTSYSDEHQVCLNDKGGTFDCVGMGPGSDDYGNGVDLGDVNGDGHLDAVFAHTGGVTSPDVVCLGDGLGGFSCSDFGPGVNYHHNVALGDVNNDGDLDAVFAGQELNTVCLGDGSGDFVCSDFPGDHRNSKDVDLGDFNGDGNLDAVFANWETVFDADVLLDASDEVCLGDGLGGFTCDAIESNTFLSEGIEVADLNGDDDLDVVIATQSEDRACLGDGKGGFSCGDIGASVLAWDVAVVDIDSDGDDDALFSGYLPQTFPLPKIPVDRKCLNDGTGSFTCSDLATGTNGGIGIAAWAPPPPPSSEPAVVGLVDPSQGLWRLYDDSGVLTDQFYFGNPGDYPFVGDWNCDGVETPGMYRQSDGYVYLRNTNTQGPGDIKFFFGDPGDVPIAGDFDNDGCDTVSIYRPSNQTFYIINKLGKNDGGLGAATTSYVFGNPGDKPFVGDFNGNGTETVGLHRESTGLVYFRNSHTQGNADKQFIFGDPGDRIIAGDWNDNGTYSPALYRPSNTTMYFRYSNTQGNANNQFIPNPSSSAWLPVAGDF